MSYRIRTSQRNEPGRINTMSRAVMNPGSSRSALGIKGVRSDISPDLRSLVLS